MAALRRAPSAVVKNVMYSTLDPLPSRMFLSYIKLRARRERSGERDSV